MSDDLENIQAKLCAYLEGELDDAERAQIEQHLLANPNDRKLMEELARARQMLRQLPRQSAPPDLADAIQRQIERSALLDGTGPSEADVLTRINRWPQFVAVAAIVLLAVGLAAVVYYIVQPPSSRPPVAANTTNQPRALRANRPGAPLADDDRARGALPATRERGLSRRAFAGKGGNAEPGSGAPRSLGAARKDLPAPNAPPGFALIPSPHFDAKTAASAGASRTAAPLLLVVSAADPALANTQVKQFLTTTNADWSTVPPGPTALSGAINAAPETQSVAQSQENLYRLQASQSAQDKSLQQIRPDAASQQGPLIQSQQLAYDTQLQINQQAPQISQQQAAEPPIASNAAPSSPLQDALTPATHPTSPAAEPASASPSPNVPVAADQQVFVVRRMRPSQAAALRDTLARQQIGQRAVLLTNAPATQQSDLGAYQYAQQVAKAPTPHIGRELEATPTTSPAGFAGLPASRPADAEPSLAAKPEPTRHGAGMASPLIIQPTTSPTTSPADAPIQPGDLLSIAVPEAANSDLVRVQVIRVGNDGMMHLAQTGPEPAAGKTAPQLQEQIAAKLRAAGAANVATIQVRRLGISPATVGGAVQTQPAQQPRPTQDWSTMLQTAVPKDKPTTTPTADERVAQAAQPQQPTNDEPTDLLIVVQNQPAEAAPPAPLNQPATLPATTQAAPTTQP